MLIATKKEVSEITTAASKLGLRNKHLPAVEHAQIDEAAGTATLDNLDERVTIRLTEPGMSAVDSKYMLRLDELRRALKTVKSSTGVGLSGEDGGVCSLTDMSRNFTLSSETTIPTEEFPLRLGQDDTIRWRGAFSSEILRQIRNLSNFAKTGEDRKVLECVYFDASRKVLVATDGCVLVQYHTDAELPDKLVILPTKFVRDKLCKTGKDAEVLVTDARVQIKTGIYDYQQKLVQGTYPNYTQVIPDYSEDDTTLLYISSDDLPVIEAAMEKDDDSEVKTKIRIRWNTEGRVYVKDAGSNNITLKHGTVEHCNAELENINLNGAYLRDLLECGIRRFEIADKYKPLLISGGNLSGAWMPLREQD